ncbi:MAG TPA: hypothetical protein VK211_01720 [Kamptonema sp.]|nr:hypothetical protein [Kamptonema sp.]
MALNPNIMQAVEQLGYRVTVGDVAAKAGLDVNFAQRELNALASDAGGHLQVAESGEIAYSFPKDFRDILRNKFFRLQLQEWWQKVWRILFYLIRISFGIVLIASILLIVAAITVMLMAVNSSNDNDSGSGGDSGGFRFMPFFGFNDWWWFFYWNYDEPYYRRQRQVSGEANQMNFLESVFSFIFGDGNPNYNLDERRWQAIATLIRNNKGAIAAEQVAPYLDQLGKGYALEYEEYMLPTLARFDGRPEVSPEGQIIYHFPELQTTAAENNPQPVPSYLQELLWQFSEANSGQILLASGLGIVNLVGALILGNLLVTSPIVAKLGGFIIFVKAIYPILLIYGVAFLTIPLIRYFWIQWRNRKIEDRNLERQKRAAILTKPNLTLKQKLNYARQFAAENVISGRDLAYTTETDLSEQELEQSAKLDAEWQRRLDRSGS